MKFKELVDANWNWLKDDMLRVVIGNETDDLVTVKDAKVIYGERCVYMFFDKTVLLV